MLTSISIVCPLALLYIREMNRTLAHCEAQMLDVITADLALEAELCVWRDRPMLLDHQNNMHRRGEIDLIPPKGKVDLEYHTGKGLLPSLT